MLSIGDYVLILDGSEWHNKICIVESIDRDGIPILYSQSMQNGQRYWLYPWLMDKVDILDSNCKVVQNAICIDNYYERVGVRLIR